MQLKKQPEGCKKNPRRPEHIKIRKSVAAFALASCPQIVIAQGLGPCNVVKKRKIAKIGRKNEKKITKKRYYGIFCTGL